jgi:hypothetical protein
MGKKVKNTRSTSSGWIFLCICLFLFFVGALFFRATPAAALGTPPTIITYQAKLLNATNSPVTSATNMSFVLYDALTAGNVLYTAAGTIATPATMSITPSSGVFSVNLGDSSTNPLNTDIFKNNGSVYLEITVGAETLTPRKQITSAPFAINSAYLNGYGAATSPNFSNTIHLTKTPKRNQAGARAPDFALKKQNPSCEGFFTLMRALREAWLHLLSGRVHQVLYHPTEQ